MTEKRPGLMHGNHHHKGGVRKNNKLLKKYTKHSVGLRYSKSSNSIRKKIMGNKSRKNKKTKKTKKSKRSHKGKKIT